LVLQRIVPVVTGISDLDLKNADPTIDQQVKYIEQASKFSPEGSREEHKKHVTACNERKKSSDNGLEKQKETTVRYTQDYDKAPDTIARRQAEASVEKLDKFRKKKMRDLQEKHRRELEDLEQRQEEERMTTVTELDTDPDVNESASILTSAINEHIVFVNPTNWNRRIKGIWIWQSKITRLLKTLPMAVIGGMEDISAKKLSQTTGSWHSLTCQSRGFGSGLTLVQGI